MHTIHTHSYNICVCDGSIIYKVVGGMCPFLCCLSRNIASHMLKNKKLYDIVIKHVCNSIFLTHLCLVLNTCNLTIYLLLEFSLSTILNAYISNSYSFKLSTLLHFVANNVIQKGGRHINMVTPTFFN